MQKDEDTGALVTSDTFKDFNRLEPRLAELADITVLPLEKLDSTNMTPRHWETLGSVVAENYDLYDGFVITMGTNTLAYASSALSFSLLGIGKPVILTGSQISADAIFSDARNNLVNSVRVAVMNLAGVFVVFGIRIILGCRAKKASESELNAFQTFNEKDFGAIMIGIKLNFESNRRHDRPLSLHNGFEDNIVPFTLVPGIRGEHIRKLIDSGVKGIILRAYGSGDIPYDLLPVLEHAREKKVPIVITTQCADGKTAMGLNDVGLQALHRSVIQAFDMSMEAMSTKLMWLLKQGVPYEDLKSKMHENMAGEIDLRRSEELLNDELRALYKNTFAE